MVASCACRRVQKVNGSGDFRNRAQSISRGADRNVSSNNWSSPRYQSTSAGSSGHSPTRSRKSSTRRIRGEPVTDVLARPPVDTTDMTEQVPQRPVRTGRDRRRDVDCVRGVRQAIAFAFERIDVLGRLHGQYPVPALAASRVKLSLLMKFIKRDSRSRMTLMASSRPSSTSFGTTTIPLMSPCRMSPVLMT